MHRGNRADRDGATNVRNAQAACETDARKNVMPRPSPALTALTTSALALPGIAGTASADAPIERATATGAFSYYREDSLPVRKFDPSTGSRDRYEVFTFQARADAPVSDRVDIGLDFLYEEMSGSSPWFVTPGPDGEQLQVMSGATIEDERVDATVDIDFYLDEGKDSLSVGFSNERDYLSVHGGIGAERNYNDKNTVLNASIAGAYDWIDPTDPDFSLARPESEEKWSLDFLRAFRRSSLELRPRNSRSTSNTPRAICRIPTRRSPTLRSPAFFRTSVPTRSTKPASCSAIATISKTSALRCTATIVSM